MINRGCVSRPVKSVIRMCHSIVLLVPVIAIVVLMGACDGGNMVQTTANQTGQSQSANETAGSTPSPTPVAVIAVTPVTTPAPQAQQPEQTATPQPPSNVEVVATPALEDLLRTPACDMTLKLEDMEYGWLKGNAVPPSRQQVSSACSVHYTKGSSFSPVVQNTVAVYRSMDAAKRSYTSQENAQVTSVEYQLKHPEIGEECFINDSVALNKLLVFRKVNVVVWIWLQQDKNGAMEPYAKIVEQKIGNK